MSKAKFSTLDLIELPRSQRVILLHLLRHGPCTTEELVAKSILDPGEIHGLLDTLLTEDKIQKIEDGTFKIKLGRVTHRTTLPAQLWPALPAGDRFYSEQEAQARAERAKLCGG